MYLQYSQLEKDNKRLHNVKLIRKLQKRLQDSICEPPKKRKEGRKDVNSLRIKTAKQRILMKQLKNKLIKLSGALLIMESLQEAKKITSY